MNFIEFCKSFIDLINARYYTYCSLARVRRFAVPGCRHCQCRTVVLRMDRALRSWIRARLLLLRMLLRTTSLNEVLQLIPSCQPVTELLHSCCTCILPD